MERRRGKRMASRRGQCRKDGRLVVWERLMGDGGGRNGFAVVVLVVVSRKRRC
jgi:hypothetical protein